MLQIARSDNCIAETLNITCQCREYLEMIEEGGLEREMHVD